MNKTAEQIERDWFEESVYAQYYIRSIGRNENVPTPRISGCLDFAPGKIDDKATFCAKDSAGKYTRPELEAMWFGWQLGRSCNRIRQ